MSPNKDSPAAREEPPNTLVNLFHMAVEEAGKSVAKPVSEMGLEFIIIGNHTLKLCKG